MSSISTCDSITKPQTASTARPPKPRCTFPSLLEQSACGTLCSELLGLICRDFECIQGHLGEEIFKIQFHPQPCNFSIRESLQELALTVSCFDE